MIAPEPIPFRPEGPEPLVRNIAPGAPYPVAALGPLRPAVEAVQGATQAPVAIPAASALAVASLAVQGFADVETLGGASPLSLYLLTIAVSGERKSSCDAPLMAALREHERAEASQRLDAVTSWQNAQALWQADRERVMRAAKEAGGDRRRAAEADLASLGPAPDAPTIPDRTVSEPTFEGLTKLYAAGMPSLGIFSDEGGQFLGGHAMKSENRKMTLAALNDLWQGNPIRRTRGGDGHETLHGRRLAVHLMVQPVIARELLADRLALGSGFLPRFLICEPPSTIGTRLQHIARHDDASLAAFETRLADILRTDLPMDSRTRVLEPRRLRLSPKAQVLLVRYADAVEQQQAPGGPLAHVTGFASKSAEMAARIAAVLTLWDDLHAPEVSKQDMANGIDLAQFYLSEAVRLVEAAALSPEVERAELLRRWLLESWPHPEVTSADVVNRGPNRLREAPKAHAALKLLHDHGWLVPLPSGTVIRGKARKAVWRIVRGGDDVV